MLFRGHKGKSSAANIADEKSNEISKKKSGEIANRVTKMVEFRTTPYCAWSRRSFSILHGSYGHDGLPRKWPRA